MLFIYKKSFLDAFDSLSENEKQLAREADRRIRNRYAGRKAALGLGIKKLYQSPRGTIYEARVGLALRIVWAEHGAQVAFVLLGNHDQVRRYLRNL